jgi:Animal haem peroxidase
MPRRHSKPVRGLEAFESKTTEPNVAGRFGRLFPADDEQLSSEILAALAASMNGDGPDGDNSIVDQDFEDENHNKLPGSDALRITSGYTYLGQFIDHDLTFDPTSTLESTIDPSATVNFRSPRFDLDCLYGAGPDDQPYMYEADGQRLIEGVGGDVFRFGERAVIGDPRNDENHLVVQWHRVMVRFHNTVIGWLSHDPSIKKDERYKKAQELVRWTYQWLIVNDFLPRILRDEDWKEMLATAVKEKKAPMAEKLNTQFGEPFMPVEFSGAAYRFGHSMVRPSYHLNDSQVRLRDGGEGAKGGNRVPIFDASEPNLNGFRPLAQPSSTVPLKIEWKYFFEFTFKNDDGKVDRPTARDRKTGKTRDVVQPAYRIDTSMTEPLARLDIPGVANNPPSLAERNMKRGARLRLPSGQNVAKALGIPPLTKIELLLEKNPNPKPGPDSRDEVNNEAVEKRVEHLGREGVDAVAATTPLWYYILAEAQMQEDAASLGRVGTHLVGGTFLALLFGDESCYLSPLNPRPNPDFNPTTGLHLDRMGLKLETVADLLKLVVPDSIGRMGVLNI